MTNYEAFIKTSWGYSLYQSFFFSFLFEANNMGCYWREGLSLSSLEVEALIVCGGLTREGLEKRIADVIKKRCANILIHDIPFCIETEKVLAGHEQERCNKCWESEFINFESGS